MEEKMREVDKKLLDFRYEIYEPQLLTRTIILFYFIF